MNLYPSIWIQSLFDVWFYTVRFRPAWYLYCDLIPNDCPF